MMYVRKGMFSVIAFCLFVVNGVLAQGEVKIAEKIKNIPEGEWVEIQKSDIGGRAFNKVHYAPNLNSLVSWGTAMHGKK